MSPFEPDEMGRSKVTRHSHSLPSLSHLNRAPSDPNRNRTRTQSQSKRYHFFSEAKSSTPLSRRRTHKRSHSNVSQSSSRRASAEFSAEQASSVSHGNGLGSSWEVQVSREMVRMAFEQGLGWSEKQVAGGAGTATQSDQTRNRVGSPFLFQGLSPTSYPSLIDTCSPDLRLQVAHTHHTPAKHCSSTLGPLYQDTFGFSSRKNTRSAMSKEDSLSPAAKSHFSERSRTSSPPSKLNTVIFTSSAVPSTSYLAPPSLSFTAATPEASPVSTFIRSASFTSPAEPSSSVLRVPSNSSAHAERPSSQGKRKADEAGVGGSGTPPKEAKEPRATFAVEPRRHRASANSNATSNAPSSYHRKRARLSASQESRPVSLASSDHQQSQTKNQNASTTGSWSSKMSKNSGFVASHHTSSPRPIPIAYHAPQRVSSRRSISQASIPISALISPHAPSVAPSTTFHMRDPRKPAPIQSTPWSLSLPAGTAEPGEGWHGWIDRGGSPLHAWLFFVGFVLFPLWWIASLVTIPKTRTLDGQEKGVVMIDDPQVEHDAKSWRVRCRVMAVISFFTYVPFVVCVAVFA
ncbi:hypothetical protein J132_01253 [Termitomyces sp. J132]|nr:hypothetical protein J132_01253 [Termitomyces sp. J132]